MTDLEMKTKESPERYIQNAGATFLAVVKLAEALAGGFLLWYLLTHMSTVPNVLRNLLEIQTEGDSKYANVYQSIFSGLQIGMIVLAALMIPDGIAFFFTRFLRKGAGVVAFFRFLSFAIGIILFLLGIAGMVLYCNSVIEAAQSFRRITIGELIGIFGTGRVAAFLAVYSIVFLIFLIYHFCAGRVMLCVRKEIKAGEIVRLKRKNRLGKVAAVCCALFVINAVLSALLISVDTERVDELAGFLKPIVTAYRLAGIAGIAASVVLAVKYFLVCRCNAEFKGAHREVLCE